MQRQFKYINMEVKPIKSDKDYRNALERLEVIFDALIDSKDEDDAEILSLLIENYENEHYPIEAPDPNRSDKNSNGGIKYAPKGFSWNNRRKKSRI